MYTKEIQIAPRGAYTGRKNIVTLAIATTKSGLQNGLVMKTTSTKNKTIHEKNVKKTKELEALFTQSSDTPHTHV